MKDVIIFEDHDGDAPDGRPIIRVWAECPCGHKIAKYEWYIPKCPKCGDTMNWEV